MRVMQLVERVRLPWEREAIVSQPRTNPAVEDAGEKDYRVAAQERGRE